MRRHQENLFLLTTCALLAACTATIDPSNPSGGDDGTGPGSSSSTNPGGDDENDTTTPTYASEHPRILLNTRKADLQASLAANTPAAVRFKTVVDSWLGGNDLGLSAWHAALMGQLTGQPQYCAKAIAVVDAMVT